MNTYEVRRIPIVDSGLHPKPLDTRIKELCELMSTGGFDLAAMAEADGQLLLTFKSTP